MWLYVPEELTEPFDLTPGQVQNLRCAAEHLVARADGGSDKQENIVAACLACNGRRHATKRPLKADAYIGFVRRQLASDGWHRAKVRELIRALAAGQSSRWLVPRRGAAQGDRKILSLKLGEAT
jgi:hypothetical protein